MRALLPVAFLASIAGITVAVAQELLNLSSSDTLEIRDSRLAFAEIVYSNGLSANSRPGDFDLSIHGVTFKVRIDVQTLGQKERVTVQPHEDGYVAIPYSADLEDGESVTIMIVPPMF